MTAPRSPSLFKHAYAVKLTRAAVRGSELCQQIQPASGSAWSTLQHTGQLDQKKANWFDGDGAHAPRTVVVYDDDLVLHFGHLHAAVGVADPPVRLHVKHL